MLNVYSLKLTDVFIGLAHKLREPEFTFPTENENRVSLTNPSRCKSGVVGGHKRFNTNIDRGTTIKARYISVLSYELFIRTVK